MDPSASWAHPEHCWCTQIVQQLLGEVEAASAAMLAGLLARLKGSIQLPECLRVVGCLRRLAAFPEPELRRRCVALAVLGSLLSRPCIFCITMIYVGERAS